MSQSVCLCKGDKDECVSGYALSGVIEMLIKLRFCSPLTPTPPPSVCLQQEGAAAPTSVLLSNQSEALCIGVVTMVPT